MNNLQVTRNAKRSDTQWGRRSLTTFHGTAIDAARDILRGEKLNTVKAASNKIDGPPGFFLATEITDAEFFALRRAPGGALELTCQQKQWDDSNRRERFDDRFHRVTLPDSLVMKL